MVPSPLYPQLRTSKFHVFSSVDPDGTVNNHYKPDHVLRRLCKLYTVSSELPYRRLKWYTQMIKHPTEWTALRATLCVKFAWETESQLDTAGQLTAAANPWLRQLFQDFVALSVVDSSFPNPLELPDGLWRLLSCESPFVTKSFATNRIRSFDIEEKFAAEHDEQQIFICPICQFNSPTLSGLQCHRRRAHNVIRTATLFVAANRCPYCKRVFTTIQGVRNHITRRRNGQCP